MSRLFLPSSRSRRSNPSPFEQFSQFYQQHQQQQRQQQNSNQYGDHYSRSNSTGNSSQDQFSGVEEADFEIIDEESEPNKNS